MSIFTKYSEFEEETSEQTQRRIELHPYNRNLPENAPKVDWDYVYEDPETGINPHFIRERREKQLQNGEEITE